MTNQNRSSITRSQPQYPQQIQQNPEDFAIVPVVEWNRLQANQVNLYPGRKENIAHDKAVAYGGAVLKAGIAVLLGCIGVSAIVSSCQPKVAPPQQIIIREAPVATPQPEVKTPNSECIAFCDIK